MTGTRQHTSEPVRLLVTGRQTLGRFALIEITVRAGEDLPPHIHTREDELICVRRGEVTVHLDGSRRRCGAGDSAILPRGSEHTWRVESAEATLLVLAIPAGIEAYYRELAGLIAADQRIERLIAASARYGIEFVGPATAATR